MADLKVTRYSAQSVESSFVMKVTAISKIESKLVKQIASLEKKLSKDSDGSIINRCYRKNILRLRGDIQKKLNNLRVKKTSYENKLNSNITNDEQKLKDQGLYWGA